jgi:hypothetical protein
VPVSFVKMHTDRSTRDPPAIHFPPRAILVTDMKKELKPYLFLAAGLFVFGGIIIAGIFGIFRASPGSGSSDQPIFSSPLRSGGTGAPQSPPGKKPKSVIKSLLKDGRPVYTVYGSFPAVPKYDTHNILTGSFIIDEDPRSRPIPIIMTLKNAKINVGTAKESLHKTIVWELESTDSLRQKIQASEAGMLRLMAIEKTNSEYDTDVERVMNSIIEGYWNIPDDFVLHPPMVGVIH